MSQPVVCGVYSLFLHHELVYVGKSTDAYKRIAEHRTKGREFDFATVTACPPADLDWIEAALIRAWEPRQNRNHKSKEAVVREIIREVHTVAPAAPDPESYVSVKEAMRIIYERHLPARDFQADVRTGVVPSFSPDGRPLAPGGRRLVLIKNVDAWCAPLHQARLAAA
jgi:hypothetical protein